MEKSTHDRALKLVMNKLGCSEEMSKLLDSSQREVIVEIPLKRDNGDIKVSRAIESNTAMRSAPLKEV